MGFQLIQNGKLTIPLYHGTSSIFLGSIKEHGLGGFDPIKKYNIINIFRELYSLADRCSLLSEYERQQYDSFLEHNNENRQEGSVMNFRHGQVYLTPSQCAAWDYANSNKYGSELLSHTFALYDRLKDDGYPINANILNSIPSPIRTNDPSPIVLKLHNVPIEYLKTEHGRPPNYQINSMQSSINDELDRISKNTQLMRNAEQNPENLDSFREMLAMTESDKKEAKEDVTSVIARHISYYFKQDNFTLLRTIQYEELVIEEAEK